MHEVTAFEDDNGRLFKSKRDAITSDFTSRVRKAWAAMPEVRDRGEPDVIGRILADPTYGARRLLIEALDFLAASESSSHSTPKQPEQKP